MKDSKRGGSRPCIWGGWDETIFEADGGKKRKRRERKGGNKGKKGME